VRVGFVEASRKPTGNPFTIKNSLLGWSKKSVPARRLNRRRERVWLLALLVLRLNVRIDRGGHP